jgi:hypothetical protein
MNSGSLESLKLSARCGCSPKARQIRLIEVWLMPIERAIERVDQWVASVGFVSRVFTITASTISSVIVRGAPGRGSSKSPPRRAATKRRRHLPTVAGVTPRSRATATFGVPVADARMIRARSAIAWALLRRRVSRSSVWRSSLVRVRSAVGRPRERGRTELVTIHAAYYFHNGLATQDTRESRKKPGVSIGLSCSTWRVRPAAPTSAAAQERFSIRVRISRETDHSFRSNPISRFGVFDHPAEGGAGALT